MEYASVQVNLLYITLGLLCCLISQHLLSIFSFSPFLAYSCSLSPPQFCK